MAKINLVPGKLSSTSAIWLGFVFLFLSACNYPAAQGISTEQIATALAATLTADSAALPTEPAATDAPAILPHSLYFLSSNGGSAQVWRLGKDAITLTQITTEGMPVDGFDVSRADGTVAFVTNNQLYLINSDGSDRRLLVDNAAADPDAANYYYTQRVGNPRFSPDGSYLAYAYDGLWIVELASNQAVHLLSNQIQPLEDGSLLLEKFYGPLEWAPNSTQLLLEIGYLEAGTMAVLNPGADPLVTEFDAAIVCCQAAWAADSSAITVASPYMGLIDAGLWRYDAVTGESTTLIGNLSGLYEFAGWPLQVTSGDLYYFYTSSTNIPEGDSVFYMVRSSADGVSNRVQLRPDAFSVREALWAEDGSLALVMSANAGSLSGPVVLAYSDGSQLQALLDEAWQLRWGP